MFEQATQVTLAVVIEHQQLQLQLRDVRDLLADMRQRLHEAIRSFASVALPGIGPRQLESMAADAAGAITLAPTSTFVVSHASNLLTILPWRRLAKSVVFAATSGGSQSVLKLAADAVGRPQLDANVVAALALLEALSASPYWDELLAGSIVLSIGRSCSTLLQREEAWASGGPAPAAIVVLASLLAAAPSFERGAEVLNTVASHWGSAPASPSLFLAAAQLLDALAKVPLPAAASRRRAFEDGLRTLFGALLKSPHEPLRNTGVRTMVAFAKCTALDNVQQFIPGALKDHLLGYATKSPAVTAGLATPAARPSPAARSVLGKRRRSARQDVLDALASAPPPAKTTKRLDGTPSAALGRAWLADAAAALRSLVKLSTSELSGVLGTPQARTDLADLRRLVAQFDAAP